MFFGFWPWFLPPALGRFWMLGRLEHFALGSWLCKHFAQDAFTRDFTIPCRRSRDKTCYLQRSFVFQQSNLTTYSMLRMLLCKIVVRLKVPASPTVAQRCLSPNPVRWSAVLRSTLWASQLRIAMPPAIATWNSQGHEDTKLLSSLSSRPSVLGSYLAPPGWIPTSGHPFALLCYRTCRGKGMSRSTSSFKEHTALRRKHKCSLTQPATDGTLPRLSSMNTFLWNFEVLQCSEMLFSCSFPANARNQDTAKHLPCIHL